MMAKVSPSWTDYFREQENPFQGWVSSLAEANALIREYEVLMQSHYVVVRETRQFGSFDLSLSHKVKHVDDGKIKKGSRISNHGIPFMITGQKLLECHQGSTRRHPKLVEENNVDHNYKQSAHKRKVTSSKKLGCESCIVLREVVLFPDFKPASATEHHQKLKSKELRAALQSSSAEKIHYEKRIFIDLPDKDSHSHHSTGDATDIKVPVKRYKDKHVKLSAGWRKQSQEVSDIVSHEPLDIHQLLREIDTAASSICKEDLQQFGERQFLIHSSFSDTVYEVDLAVPKCNCNHFARTRTLCKHFGAIFKHTNLDWNNLPHSYKGDSIFEIDIGCVDEISCSEEESQNNVLNWPTGDPTAKPVINKKGKNVETIQEEFREKLAFLTQLSYLCHDPETLERSTTTIDGIISTMQSNH